MTLDFLRPLLTIGHRRRHSPTGIPDPSPQHWRELRALRDDQLRWYLSQHGQAHLRHELQRRRARR